MYNRDIKAFIIVISCAVICAGMFFSYSRISDKYKESYVNAMVRGYELAAGQGVLQIEYAVKYGKQLDNFYNMDNIIRQVADSVPSINNIKVINEKGEVCYSLYEDKNWKANPLELVKLAGGDSGQPYINQEGFYYIPQRIEDKTGNLVGALVLNLKKDILEDGPSGFNKEYSLQLLIFFAAAIILVIAIVSRLKMGEEGKSLPVSSIIAVVLLSFLLTGIYNLYMIYITSDQLRSSTEQISSWVCSIVQLDIDNVLRKGATIDLIYDINGWLERICSSVPEIKNLFLDNDNKVNAIISQSYIQQRVNDVIKTGALVIFAVMTVQTAIAVSASFMKSRLPLPAGKNTGVQS
jgi:hypothetical protein